MDIKHAIANNEHMLKSKNIAFVRELLYSLKDVNCSYSLDDCINIHTDNIDSGYKDSIYNIASLLKPWRKGPFKIFDIFIDSEWRSYIKYNLLKKYIDLTGKTVADVGCNNGYYMFKMLELSPKEIVGFDPSALYKTQFDFINRFLKTDIKYELLGIEHLEHYGKKFDTIFCLGVLYHRKDMFSSLRSLKNSLAENGEVILDTFYIESSQDICLVPKDRYSKIPNVYFIPSISALQNICKRAGFKDFEVLEKMITSTNEQRKTEWILGESLGDFLDKKDSSKTVEGYPAPKRVYIKIN